MQPNSAAPPRLLDQVRQQARLLHFSIRTEEAYVGWVRRFVLFHNKQHPKDLGAPAIEAFLTHLAVIDQVAASTQNQALAALLFLYQRVLRQDLGAFAPVRARRPGRIPEVLSVGELRAVLGGMEGGARLMAELLYGAGLRLLECCRLRVKDLDFERNQIVVRAGKGQQDRVVPLPQRCRGALEAQVERVREQHAADLAAGHGRVWLPGGLARKYPEAERELAWQDVFPAARLSVDPRVDDGVWRRHHDHENNLQKAVRKAVLAAGIAKKASCHTLRHSFATHLLEAGSSVRCGSGRRSWATKW